MFFLQMSGFPGSGKSTLSRIIAERTGAIIIDHDVVKTALMESLDTTTNNKPIGSMAYHIEWSLIDFYLSQGHKVIHDSPCLYDEMLDRGAKLTKKYNVSYKFVECFLNDIKEINFRLTQRNRLISQIERVQSEEGFKAALQKNKRPENVNYLIVDTSQLIESYIKKVMDYMND